MDKMVGDCEGEKVVLGNLFLSSFSNLYKLLRPLSGSHFPFFSRLLSDVVRIGV